MKYELHVHLMAAELAKLELLPDDHARRIVDNLMRDYATAGVDQHNQVSWLSPRK